MQQDFKTNDYPHLKCSVTKASLATSIPPPEAPILLEAEPWNNKYEGKHIEFRCGFLLLIK
jgi:hypothetical protein